MHCCSCQSSKRFLGIILSSEAVATSSTCHVVIVEWFIQPHEGISASLRFSLAEVKSVCQCQARQKPFNAPQKMEASMQGPTAEDPRPKPEATKNWAEFLQQLPSFIHRVRSHVDQPSLDVTEDVVWWLRVAFDAPGMQRNRGAAIFAAWDVFAQLADLPQTGTTWSLNFKHPRQHCSLINCTAPAI